MWTDNQFFATSLQPLGHGHGSSNGSSWRIAKAGGRNGTPYGVTFNNMRGRKKPAGVWTNNMDGRITLAYGTRLWTWFRASMVNNMAVLVAVRVRQWHSSN